MTMPPRTPPRRARARGLGWPIAVTVVLAATVALNLYVLHLARADPSVAVEPDYYGKATRFDDEVAQRQRNATLGWRIAPAVDARAADGATLRLRLVDAAGAPVDGAAVSVQAFAVARSADVLRATLAADAAGSYAARLPMRRGGQWELRVVAVRGADTFTAVERVDVGG